MVEVLMARRGGATALAVTTGMTRREEWARQARLHRPHGILGELGEVLGWVAGAEETAGARPRLRSMRARVKAGRSRTAVQSRPATQRGVGRRSSLARSAYVIDQALCRHPRNHGLRHRPGAPRLSPQHVLHVADDARAPRALHGAR